MFYSGIFTKVKGRTAREAINKYAPDGTLIAEFTLGVGGGSIKYPVMWVHVAVWDRLAEEVFELLDKKGIPVEVEGMLQVRMYEGRRGRDVWIELKNVRELKVFNRDGELEKVLSGDVKECKEEAVKNR
ncbi:single-stranded DNA-binding protein [Chloroflexota bacterium]